MERLTKKAVGCFRYDLKDHKHINGEFGDYDAFFDYNMAVKRLGEYEDTGLEPEDINEFVNSYKTMRDNEEARVQLMCGTGAIHPERAAEITKAESEGRLLVLPCKVGDTVYKLWYAPCHNGETYPDGVGCDGCVDKCDIHKEITEYIVPNANFIWVNFVMKGNTVYFLTREKAEKALEGTSDGSM